MSRGYWFLIGVLVIAAAMFEGCGGNSNFNPGATSTIPGSQPANTAAVIRGKGAAKTSADVLAQIPRSLPPDVVKQAAGQQFPARTASPSPSPSQSPVPASAMIPAGALPPVMDQGVLGSCGAFAIGYGLTTYVITQASGLSPSNPLQESSPAYMYAEACINEKQSCIQNQSRGTDAADYFDFLILKGSQTVSAYPYPSFNNFTESCGLCNELTQEVNAGASPSPTPSSSPPVCGPAFVLPAAVSSFQLGSDALINDPTAGINGNSGTNPIQQFIANGHAVAILVQTYKGMDQWYSPLPATVFTGQGGLSGDYHFMMIVGYDDTIAWTDPSGNQGNGAFFIQNSWGTGFGTNGLWWMSYPAFANSISEAWVADPVDSTKPTTGATALTVSGGGNAPRGLVKASQAVDRSQENVTVYLAAKFNFDRAVQVSQISLTAPNGQKVSSSLLKLIQSGHLHFSRRDGMAFPTGTWQIQLSAIDPTCAGCGAVTYQAAIQVDAPKQTVPLASDLGSTVYGPTLVPATLQ